MTAAPVIAPSGPRGRSFESLPLLSVSLPFATRAEDAIEFRAVLFGRKLMAVMRANGGSDLELRVVAVVPE